MDNELLDLINEYNNKKILADLSFATKVCDIVVRETDLTNYYKGIYQSQDKDLCHYDMENKIIEINFDNIMIKSKKNKNKLIDEYVYFYNLLVVEILLHELEHVHQEKVKREGKISIEKKLILLNDARIYYVDGSNNKCSIKDRLVYNHKINKYIRHYNRNHDKAPIERLANLRSQSYTSFLSDKLDDRFGIKAYQIYVTLSFMDQLRKGYKLVGNYTNSPSLDFLIKMKCTNNKQIIESDYDFINPNITFNERLLYGLPLTKDEYIMVKTGDIRGYHE